MTSEIPKPKWIVNIHRETCALVEAQLNKLLSSEQYSAALELVGREGKKLSKPVLFYLGGGQRTNGVSLGPQRLLIRTSRITKTVVFDISNNCFRFCESLKEIKTPRPGLELEGQEDQSHRIFFEEATKSQQEMLLKETLKTIFMIREREISRR